MSRHLLLYPEFVLPLPADLWITPDEAGHQRHAEWGKQHFGAWFGALDRETRAALAEYKQQSDSFQNYLRDPDCARGWSPERERRVAEQSGLLEQGLKTASMPGEVVVYRGVRGPHPRAITPGMILADPAFMATSLSLAVAEYFACWDDQDELATVLAIRLHAGQPGAWIEDLVDNVREYEVLLPPALNLVVDSVSAVSFPEQQPSEAQHGAEAMRRRVVCHILHQP